MKNAATRRASFTRQQTRFRGAEDDIGNLREGLPRRAPGRGMIVRADLPESVAAAATPDSEAKPEVTKDEEPKCTSFRS